jgi:hypothetical protein
VTPTPSAPKRRIPRKLLAALAVTAGVVLALFELPPALAGNPESWFWVVVAAVLVLFGLAEAFAGR